MSLGAGLANPWGALALVAVGVLLALHRWDRRRRVVVVASLYLWQRIPAAPLERRRRVRMDPLLAARLAAMLALVAAFVRPWIAAPARAVVAPASIVVLDVSASMQTREARGTRFDAARARAASLADAASETMLLAAGARPRVAMRWTADPMLVRRALETLAPLDVAADLDAAVALALGEAAARPGARVAVVTDEPRPASRLPDADLTRVDWMQVGRSDDNVGIAALGVDAPALHPLDDATATVEVRNWSHGARTVGLMARVGGRTWIERRVELPSRGTATVHLGHPPASGVLEVRLADGDAFAADDVARAWIPAHPPLDVVVVSDAAHESSVLAELGRAVRNARVASVSTSAWASLAPARDRIVIFDGVAPDAVSAVPALYVAPPPGRGPCAAIARVADAAVVDWDDAHPLVRGVGSLASLVVHAASALADVPWGVAVASAASAERAFPFLVAGELDGHRVACMAAGPTAPLATTDQLPLVVLTLATLGWLQDGDAAPLVVRTGEVVHAPGGESDDAALRIAGTPPVLVAERVGAFHAGDRLVLANLFDPHESDVGRDEPTDWPAAPSSSATPGARDAREIGGTLAGLAAALLALEWVMWLGRPA